MAIIGKFTKQDDGTLLGGIKTLTIDVIATLAPAPKKSDKAPDYHLNSYGFELGAAWKRPGENGETYLSVRIDDPSFAAPINCRLVKTGIEHGYSLIWERDRPRS
jgi:uncharacterized protein (DUF736 family)